MRSAVDICMALCAQRILRRGLDVSDLDIAGRKEEYLEYLAAISALRARAEKVCPMVHRLAWRQAGM